MFDNDAPHLYTSDPQSCLTAISAQMMLVRAKEDVHRVMAAAVLPTTEKRRKKEMRREREYIPHGFVSSAFGQDLIPSLSSSPLLVKPSTYHTAFFIVSRDPQP